MFDGFKVMSVNAQFDELTNNDLLEFEGIHSEKTGEVANSRKSIARYNSLTFLIHRHKSGNINSIELVGSIHKFANAGRHNYDDFTAYRLLGALSSLYSDLGINPTAQELNNLEFGVNIELPFPVKNVLDSLICFKGKPFQVLEKDGMSYYQVAFSQYILKIYDKSRQYDLNRHVLRFEIKVIKMAFLHGREDKITIRYLSDLMHPANYPKLGNLLTEYFSAILFDGPTGSGKDSDLVMMGRNWKYWQRPTGISAGDRKKLERDEVEFRRLVRSEYQSAVGRLLAEKWQQLTAVTPGLMSQIYRVVESWECRKFTDPQNSHLSQIYPLSIVSDCDIEEITQPQETRVKTSSRKKGATIDDRSKKKQICQQVNGPKWIQPKVKKTSIVGAAVGSKETLSDPLPDKRETPEYYAYLIPPLLHNPTTRATFHFELNNRPQRNGLYTVFLRITCNRIQKKIHTGIEIRKEHFNPHAKPVKWIRMPEPRHAAYNWKLKNLMDCYEKLFDTLTASGIDAITHRLKDWPALAEKERQKIVVRELKGRKLHKNQA